MKKIIKVFFVLNMGCFVFLSAGLTDFKTIQEAKEAYEAKEYGKSAVLLNSLDTKSPQKIYNTGNAYYKAKKYDEAIKAYEQAQGIDEAARLHNIGNSYFQKNNLDKAIDSYEKVLKIKEDKDTRFNLELAKEKKKQQENEKSRQNDQKDTDKNESNKDQNQQQQNNQNNDQKNIDKNKQNDQQKQDRQNKNQEQNDKQQQNNQNNDQQNVDKNKQNDQQKQDKNQKKEEVSREEQAQHRSNKKEETPSAQTQTSAPLSQEEKLKAEELKRLLKKIGDQKMPALMYRMDNQKTQRSEDAKPW
jgi:Ca-activated chloride channel family protein